MSIEAPGLIELSEEPRTFSVDKLLEDFERQRGHESLKDAKPLTFALEDRETVHTVTAPILSIEAKANNTEERQPEEEKEPKDVILAAEIDTVYNPSKSFFGQISARVENLGSEASRVVCFKEDNGIYIPDKKAPSFDLAQDPAYMADVHGQNIFTFNRVETLPGSSKVVNWRQEFYAFKGGIENLDADNPLAIGPEKQKGCRIFQWPDGKVGVFTRPQGGIAGRGKIAYVEIDTLGELQDAIPRAEIIPGVFREDEWGGINDVTPLSPDKAGALGHIARMNENAKKDYYTFLAVFDRQSRTFNEMEIVVVASKLPFEVMDKKGDLGDVSYPGGMCQDRDDALTIYGGLGDTMGGKIPNVDAGLFKKYI